MAMLIRVVDLETTGFEPPEAEICQIGWVDLISRGTDLVGGPIDWSVVGPFAELFVKPDRPIPPETSAIHHIIDDDVVGAPKWEQVRELLLVSDDRPVSAFAAHNLKFEAQWLTPEFTDGRLGICTYKSALRLWPDAAGHSNQALRYWRKPEGLDRHIASVSHRAMPDAYVTAFLLRDMLNDGASIDQLVQWSGEPALQVKCHIGKFRGSKWEEVDSGFMRWLLDRDFDEDVKHTCRYWLGRRAKEAV